MTIAYCHAPRFIHGAVRDIAPLAVKDSDRDSWCAKIVGAAPLDQGQLEEVTARLVERLNENEALRQQLARIAAILGPILQQAIDIAAKRNYEPWCPAAVSLTIQQARELQALLEGT